MDQERNGEGTDIQNEKEDRTTDTVEFFQLFKEFCDQFYANKF